MEEPDDDDDEVDKEWIFSGGRLMLLTKVHASKRELMIHRRCVCWKWEKYCHHFYDCEEERRWDGCTHLWKEYGL